MMTEEGAKAFLAAHPKPWSYSMDFGECWAIDAATDTMTPWDLVAYIEYLEAKTSPTANLQKMLDVLNTPVATLPPFTLSVFEPVLNEDALKAAMDYAGRCYREIVSAAESYKNITPTEKRIEEKGRES